jgi:prepilin-type N-terminal cleavage/methylation domain-containing protein
MSSKERGFTLVELILVMGILSLTLLLTIPAWERVADSCRLKADAAKLAAVMRSARQDAVTSGFAQTVVFCPDGRYKVYNLANSSCTTYRLGKGVAPAGIPTFTSKFSDYPACTFSPLGNPLGGGTVALKSGSGQYIYVITNPIQGRIRISSQPPESWQ